MPPDRSGNTHRRSPPPGGFVPPSGLRRAGGLSTQGVNGEPAPRAMTAFLGFGTALPEHVIGQEAAQAALGRLWPRLRAGAASAETVTRHTVESLERIIERRSVGEAMQLYARHAP